MQLEELTGQGRQHVQAGDAEVAKAMHNLVDTVNLWRDLSRKGGVDVGLSHGRYAHLLGLKALPHC